MAKPLTFVIGGKEYELGSDFQHPGGQEVLLQHAGEDITELFDGSLGGHAHSKAARALLERFERGRPNVAQRTEEGQAQIDESKPLLEQVWRLGDAYDTWVHSPVPGQPRFFHSKWAERVTKVKWWVVPLLWLPLVSYAFRQALLASLAPGAAALLGGAGVAAWGLTEYCIHRFIFHAKPRSGWAIFLHFLFHGCHHKFPMDVERLVFPPIPASWAVYFFYALLHALLPKGAALAVFGGMLLGYVCYDTTHYFQHSGLVGGTLRAAHMHHHYVDCSVNYGISSSMFDVLLGTFAGKAARERARGRAKAD